MRSIDKDQIAESVLKRWRNLATAPQTISFPHMELMAGDWEPSIVKGSGEIRFGSPTGFEYTLSGLPDDVAYTLKLLWTCNGFVPVTYLIMPPWLRTRAG
jgi:hypothetical protein